MKYEVGGSIKLKNETRRFTVEFEAQSERHLRDKVMAHFGGKYRARRTSVKISSIREIGE